MREMTDRIAAAERNESFGKPGFAARPVFSSCTKRCDA